MLYFSAPTERTVVHNLPGVSIESDLNAQPFLGVVRQELPAVVLLNVVRLLRDLHDRAAVSSVCRFWRAVTYYWTDVHEIIINHSYFDEDYFKCAINADGNTT
ncbi:unnamed protein product [Toxocara canis]|uniref:F-box_5 domain-containing protein n=1 Tax=Toxocara canis TaxID=6265 RepID=A0A183UP67_TOXCA|nr:unnamed protein product [Toxocara canis]